MHADLSVQKGKELPMLEWFFEIQPVKPLQQNERSTLKWGPRSGTPPSLCGSLERRSCRILSMHWVSLRLKPLERM